MEWNQTAGFLQGAHDLSSALSISPIADLFPGPIAVYRRASPMLPPDQASSAK
jgi:hypothetical protein